MFFFSFPAADILQYTPKMTLKLKIGDEEITEEGQLFMEATFITE